MRRHHGAKSGVIIAACTALLFLLAALAGCGGTTTTTAAPEPSTTAPPASTTTSQGTVIRVDESSNGSVIHAQPGATLQVVLKGEPAAGYTWNLVPPQPQYLRTLPGPDISRDSNLEGAPATYTFSFLVMSIGESKVHANYVSSLGKTEKSFAVTVKTESAKVTTSTHPTTTSTAQPTTTTEPPTTTTTKPRPTTTTQPNTVYIDERYDGQVVHVDTGWKLVLTLQGNPSTGFLWRIDQPVEDDVIKLAEEPEYQPFGPDPGEGGVYVWTFNVVAAGATALELHYAGPGGEVTNNFFVGVVVEK